jgi:hypothetical protein
MMRQSASVSLETIKEKKVEEKANLHGVTY